LTPLHFAANNGHLKVVEYLVNHKADINAKNNIIYFNYLTRLPFISHLEMVIIGL